MKEKYKNKQIEGENKSSRGANRKRKAKKYAYPEIKGSTRGLGAKNGK